MRHSLVHLVAALSVLTVVRAAASDGAENLAARKEMPEGKGLAAAFVADRGARTHADVIFADDFETMRFHPPNTDVDFRPGKWGSGALARFRSFAVSG